MNNFTHFILTKFNVPQKGIGIDHLDEGYLHKRFKLFDDFCYPSVRSQKNINFKWLVFFDSRTPRVFKEKIKEYQRWESFIPVYVEENDSLEDGLRKAILDNLCRGADYLITTNLDNDDAISKDFVKIVQENFKEQDFMFISFLYGYMYKIGINELELREYLSNPFLSLIERLNCFKTVWYLSHALLEREIKSEAKRYIIIRPTWLQVIHDSNVINRCDENAIWQPIERLGSNFAINIELQKKSSALRFKEICYRVYGLSISKRKRNAGVKKIRKITGILAPSLLLTFKRLKMALIYKR